MPVMSARSRSERTGLAFVVLGVTLTVGVLVLTGLHAVDSSRQPGLLGASTGFILVGAVMYATGWLGRRKPGPGSGSER